MWERHARDLAGKTEGKRPPGIPGYIWENIIKTGLQEIVWERGLSNTG